MRKQKISSILRIFQEELLSFLLQVAGIKKWSHFCYEKELPCVAETNTMNRHYISVLGLATWAGNTVILVARLARTGNKFHLRKYHKYQSEFIEVGGHFINIKFVVKSKITNNC